MTRRVQDLCIPIMSIIAAFMAYECPSEIGMMYKQKWNV